MKNEAFFDFSTKVEKELKSFGDSHVGHRVIDKIWNESVKVLELNQLKGLLQV